MSRFRKTISIYLAIGLFFFSFAAQASAQRIRNERDVRNIIRSLNSKIDDLQSSLRFGLRNSAVNRQMAEAAEKDVAGLSRKVRDFEMNFYQRRENSEDVRDILLAAKPISDFLEINRVNNTVQRDWAEIRNLLDQLAANYGVSWNWTTGNSSNSYPTTLSDSFGLTGTYRLDASRSEDIRDIIENSDVQTENQRRDLESKLEAPQQIALEVRGNQVTLASSKGSAVTFTADGRIRTENVNGRTIRTRALLRGQELTVSSLGGETDYTIIFASLDNGRSLKVTRRITTDYLRQTIFADSFYVKTDSIARLDLERDYPTSDYPTASDDDYSSNDPNDDPRISTTRRTGDFIVPNGTVVSGILENDLNTKISQNNDRFRILVQSPNEFRGAIIEGYVSGISRSGRVSGSSKMTFNFERIILRNGQTYEFAGYLQSVTDHNGKTIKVDTEGAAKGDNQTKETLKRTGIGAGAGAIIGAIIGGAKGAAIGAVIGSGAGAGSVIAQGKDDLELKQGSTLVIQSSSPNR